NIATITATAAGTGASGSRQVQIVGSSLSLSTTSTSVASGTPLTITTATLNSGGMPVPGQPLRYSIASTSTGAGTLSAATGITGGTGTATVNVTGTSAGNIDVLVEWLDSTGAVTASATKTVTISGTSVGTFAVTTPAASPDPAYIGTNESVVVSVPTTGVPNVRFATTLGSWVANGQKIYTAPNPGTGSLTVSFNPGSLAGNANVQVDALDASGAVLSSQNFIFSVSAPSTSASSITLQSNVSILPLSDGVNLSTATLTAMVRDSSNSPVGGANVFFELVNSTGSGESISPVVVTTNSTDPQGQAQATFTAGTSSTTQGHAVKATVVGTAISATTPITVGGTAASVTLGLSTTVSIINSNTMYSLPVSVQVVDSNGNRVSGAVVSLSLWPSYYYKGERDADCKVVEYFGFPNEDTSNFLTLDPGEDIDGPGGYTYLVLSPATPPSAGYGTPDNMLWPAPSDAGAIPSTVTTDADGTATFDWTYMKTYANWVGARIRATIQVQGTESSTDFYAMLRAAVTDVKSPCTLPDSPYN
ncbi:MAG: Ig-like domain-containing protein, partial [Gammaproteobacteria bacterium]|nr:Ig-like domain-containing protein [Gammaproteobacteria bacterium]